MGVRASIPFEKYKRNVTSCPIEAKTEESRKKYASTSFFFPNQEVSLEEGNRHHWIEV